MSIADQIRAQREQIKRRDPALRFGFGQSMVPGTCTIEATLLDMPMPLATVWYSFVGRGEIQVMNSFVDERYRRCGLRTLLHERMLACYPAVDRIVTGGATQSGRAWLKSAGFKKCRTGYEFRRRVKRGAR